MIKAFLNSSTSGCPVYSTAEHSLSCLGSPCGLWCQCFRLGRTSNRSGVVYSPWGHLTRFEARHLPERSWKIMKAFQHWTLSQAFSCNPALLHMSSLLFFTVVVRNWNPADIETFVVSLRWLCGTLCGFCGTPCFNIPNVLHAFEFKGPSMRHLLTFGMFQGTHFWAFCRLASSCPALTLAGKRRRAAVRLTWVRHRTYNYKQCMAMSFTTGIKKHQKHSETLSSQLQCSDVSWFKSLDMFHTIGHLPAAYQLAALQSM